MRTALLENLKAVLPLPDINLFKGILTAEAEIIGLADRGWQFGEITKVPYDYVERLTYHAVIMIPWDWELTTFLEWYSSNVPMFLPSEPFMWMIIQVCLMYQPERFKMLKPEFW